MTEQATLMAAAREAWLYVLPLIELANTRAGQGALAAAPNAFSHLRNLADHRMRAVTTPNNDTLYSSAQIDLRDGPVTLTLPAAGERYLSVALMDAYTNNFAVLGTRTTGEEGGRFQLVGPADAVEGADVIRAPTPYVWALGRVLVDGPDDLDAARAVQGGLSIQGPARPPWQPAVHRRAPWREYFAAASRLLAENPPPVTDRALLARIAPLGLGSSTFHSDRFDADEAAAIEDGVALAQRDVRGGGIGATIIDGWMYPEPELGDFGQAYQYRAMVAVAGLAALPPAEAMYMRAIGPEHGLFDGTKEWTLTFAAGGWPPVDSFWSLTLYEATPEGQFFFTDNPIRRYAIGDRTPGLTPEPDGSLRLRIGNTRPDDDQLGNWLPSPAGPFALFMRAYLPRRALLSGRYRLPPVQPGE